VNQISCSPSEGANTQLSITDGHDGTAKAIHDTHTHPDLGVSQKGNVVQPVSGKKGLEMIVGMEIRILNVCPRSLSRLF